MKKLNWILGIMAVIVGITACNNDKEQVVKGVITEGSMNTLMIATAKGDTLSVSTMDAERVVENGILLGDTASVYYKEKLQDGMIMATKIVVVSGPKECMELLGTWVQPVNGMPGKVQGICLKSGGVAESVNMATLVYEGWQKKENQLILMGKSIGNGQTIVFADTLHIDLVTADSLVLSEGAYVERYARQE